MRILILRILYTNQMVLVQFACLLRRKREDISRSVIWNISVFHPAGPFSSPFHQRSLVVHYPLFSEPKAARKTLSRDEKITSAEIFLLWFVSRCCCCAQRWNNKNIFVIKDTFYECTSKHFGWLLTWNKNVFI